MEWSATADAVCAFGEHEMLTLAVDGWRPGGDPPAIEAAVDAAAGGTARAVRVPPGEPELVGETRRPLSDGTLQTAPHEIVVDASFETRVTFAGPATVDPDPDGTWLRFPARTAVTIGFREDRGPRDTVTVPPRPSGVATAVTAAARTHRTDGPARSHPGYRPRTPRVAFVEDASPDVAPDATRPTLTVPADTVAVLVAAPLAYYLGADLRTDDGDPSLRADGVEYGFDPLPGFADEAGTLLRRLCTIDARLRDVPGETGRLVSDDDAGELWEDATPIQRLWAAVEGPVEGVNDEPMEAMVDDAGRDRASWPLVTYVDADLENARYLPYLLDHLSLVYPADASPLDPQALLKRSLEEFFRGDTPSVDTVEPSLADGRHHAWRGDGTPIEAFTLLGAGDRRFDAGFEVDVVCNDAEMRSERTVAEVYRDRLAGRDIDVRVHDRLTTTALASLFERSTDLVHFVGHCEVDGLVCPDGHLAAADLETCGADAVFLNACGSYHEGFDLVRRGATVSGVTLTTVLDDQAVTVGTTFAELLASGFAFARALSLARGEILAGRDYVVVGDGTHRLRPHRGRAGVFRLDQVADGFRVAYHAAAPDAAGRRCPDLLATLDRGGADPADRDEDARPDGPDGPEPDDRDAESVAWAPAEGTLDAAGVRALFERHRAPVRFDGDLRWTDELLATLPEL